MIKVLKNNINLLFEETLNIIKDAFIIFDQNEEVILVNSYAESLFNYTSEELIGNTLEFLVPDRFYMHAKQLKLQMQEYEDIQKERTHEFYILKKNGVELPVEITLKQILTPQGIFTLSFFRDISKQKTLELTLKETNAKLHEVQDIARIGYWNYNIIKDTLEWSKELFRIFGFHPEETVLTLGKFLEAVHKDDRDYVENIYNSFVQNNVHFKISYRIIRPDGEIRTLQEKCKNFYDQKGQPIGSIGIVQDVSEQKQTEEALRESESRFRDISFSMADYIWEVNLDGCYTYISDNVKQVLGYKPEELIGKSMFELVSNRYSDIYEQFFQEKLQVQSAIEDLEIAVKHKNGKMIHLLSNGMPVIDKKGKIIGYRGVDKNISEKKRAEEVLLSSLKLAQMAPSLTVDEVINTVLEESVKLTESKIGFFLFINTDEDKIDKQIWTKKTWKNCKIKNEAKHQFISKAGIWADCIKKKKPLIFNDYQTIKLKKGTPQEHIPLIRILTVPVFEEGKTVAVIGVGNKIEDYTRFDKDQLALLAENAWSIIQRRKYEESLKEFEVRYKTLFKNVGDAILISTLNGKLIDANDIAFKNLGYSREELLKMDFKDINSPEDRKHYSKRIKKLIEQGGLHYKSIHLSKQGEEIPVEINSKVFQFEGKQLILSLVRDIKVRKKQLTN